MEMPFDYFDGCECSSCRDYTEYLKRQSIVIKTVEMKTPPKVAGYTEQKPEVIRLVNHNKEREELVLRDFDEYAKCSDDLVDKRWLAIARTKLEQAFMAANRAFFQPQRVKLKGE